MNDSPPLSSLQVLYRDEQLIAVHKPAGLLVHRSPIDRHETRFLLQLLRDQIGQRVFPVHRLDKPTSGVMVLALDRESARALGEQFTQGLVHKEYLAVCRGYTAEAGRIDYALKEAADPYDDAPPDSDKPAQSAITEYLRYARLELPIAVGRYPSVRYSLLLLQPHQGRRHQLRRHMKHIFHPILGDTSYGDGRQNRAFQQFFSVSELMLCAWRIRCTHPYHGTNLQFSSPLSPALRHVLSAAPWVFESHHSARELLALNEQQASVACSSHTAN